MKFLESILRSIFISVFPASALMVLIYSIFQIIEKGLSIDQLSVFLISGSIVFFFAGIFIIPRARTDKNLKSYSLVVILAFAILVFRSFFTTFNKELIGVASILTIAWMFYLIWYSKFNSRANKKLEVGQQLEEFQLENTNKKKVSSTSFIGQHSIFLFYRGNWCPLCMAQIKEVTTQYKMLEELGVNTVLVSPQPHKQSKKLADKFKLNFHFLVDYKNKVAKQLGILAKNGIPAGFQILGYESDTVLPTVIITNTKGQIIFSDLTDNYRIRPEPDSFLKIIRASIE